MYFPFCWKTCIYTVNIFSKFVTSENANLKKLCSHFNWDIFVLTSASCYLKESLGPQISQLFCVLLPSTHV